MKEKKNIAVMSTYDWILKENNYGSLFQYYALQEFLKTKGHKTYWIRYTPSKKKPAANKSSFIRSIISKARYTKNNFPLIIRDTTSYLKKEAVRKINRRLTRIDKECSRKIKSFANNHLNLSKNEYVSFDEIKENPPLADAYIAGSDQVWSSLSKAYYLEFVPEGKKRYSYGASFGKSEFSSKECDVISEMLSKFDRISVREKQGMDICLNAGRKDTVQVVDPTLLLCQDKYWDLIKNNSESDIPPQPYAFAYFLNIHHSSEVYWEMIHDFVKNDTMDLVIVPVQGAEYLFPKKYVVMPSPINWLKYLSGSKYVITNSYHGTLFAIIMEKPFLVILQKGKTSSENGRFLSLLEILKLESRIFDQEKGSIQEQMNSPID
jgi:hypothetical protein